MKKTSKFTLFFMALILCGIKTATATTSTDSIITSKNQKSTFKRIDYYVWKQHDEKGIDKRVIERVDRLIYFDTEFISNKDGSFKIAKPALTHLEKLKNLKSKKTELWIALFNLDPIKSDVNKQDKFIADLISECKKNGFTGIDIDWEKTSMTENQYVAVVGKIARAAKRKNIGLSISNGFLSEHYLNKATRLHKEIEGINLQVYFSTNGSITLEGLKARIEQFEKAGIPKSKLFIGLPIYGMVDMKINRDAKNLRIRWDELMTIGHDPNLNQYVEPDTGNVFHYSGIPLFTAKAYFAKNHGLGGVFTWEMTKDTDYDSENSLLKILDNITENN